MSDHEGADRRSSPLLTVLLADRVIATIGHDEVPVELLPAVHLQPTDRTLRFRDETGDTRSFGIASIREEGGRVLHLSIRVGANHAVQVDGVVTADDGDPAETFEKGKAKGVRFQPFFLPPAAATNAELVGRGLFARGLHYPGVVTPGNVSLFCLCDNCHRSFRVQSFHAGFSNLVYLYCSHQPHTLVASSYLDDSPPLLRAADPAALARFAAKLPPCDACGGSFAWANPFRCPHCREPFIDFGRFPDERRREYYGNHLYGSTPQQWEPPRG